ncbi:hypothetical protein [Actinoplanes sp. NPDC049316]|uniref:hypothetical protein n=1 Tax=Actinoplanes sp. NPDC049316 TaxID=3154727 RepID=UPI00341B2CD8
MTDATDPAERLLSRLRTMFEQADPPPAELMELAKQSFVLRDLDAELAQLVEDSEQSLEDTATRGPVTVRTPGTVPQPRQLTFQVIGPHGGDEIVIAVQVEPVGAHRRLTGHLAPQGPARIEVRQPTAARPHRVDADHRGLFVIDGVLPGPMSLTCHRAGAPAVATQWILV